MKVAVERVVDRFGRWEIWVAGGSGSTPTPSSATVSGEREASLGMLRAALLTPTAEGSKLTASSQEPPAGRVICEQEVESTANWLASPPVMVGVPSARESRPLLETVMI